MKRSAAVFSLQSLEVARTLATAVWQIFQMMSRSPQTIQAQPLSLTFTEIWSSAGGGKTQSCSVAEWGGGALTKPNKTL